MSNSAPRPGSDEEWQALLGQLRHQPQPKPFFYARVHARLSATRAPRAGLPGWVRRPAYAALLGALLLAVSGDGAALRAAPPARPAGPVPHALTR
ncbi:hypothetical protein [Hymenobacter cheonanensis]|uniref:hypothetical protein n=1 Tax=Hymenobacter sp. CA2-7 TaxID=3063993 RepID=UPI0027144508|nr:hypothetical protein [Hymenobacter sp. CA2-7]MDO7887595.1 hypothetical protein [Hymenobacter sp. CA2-7]